MFCRKCGTKLDNAAVICTNCGAPTPNYHPQKEETQKRAWPIVLGVLSILASMVITFQSCAVGLAEALGSESTDSAPGMLVAILTLAGGIVLLPTRNKPTKWAAMIIFFIAAAIGIFLTDGGYGDLPIWGALALIEGIVCLVSSTRGKREKK